MSAENVYQKVFICYHNNLLASSYKMYTQPHAHSHTQTHPYKHVQDLSKHVSSASLQGLVFACFRVQKIPLQTALIGEEISAFLSLILKKILFRHLIQKLFKLTARRYYANFILLLMRNQLTFAIF